MLGICLEHISHGWGPLRPLWNRKRVRIREISPHKGKGVGLPFLEGFIEHSYITFGLEAGLSEPGVWSLTASNLMK